MVESGIVIEGVGPSWKRRLNNNGGLARKEERVIPSKSSVSRDSPRI